MKNNNTNFREWYDTLILPSWTPEPKVIGIIWSILYPIIIALTIFAVYKVYKGELNKIIEQFIEHYSDKNNYLDDYETYQYGDPDFSVHHPNRNHRRSSSIYRCQSAHQRVSRQMHCPGLIRVQTYSRFSGHILDREQRP